MEKAELLTVGGVTSLLGISRTSVQKMVDSGQLRAMRTAGGHRRILRSSVIDVLNAQPLLMAAASHAETQGARELRVLIVEDNATTSLSYRKALKRCQLPFECDVATDGLDALLKIERTRPDVLITDLQMEPFDGFRLIGAIQRDPQLAQIGLVVVTALDDAEIARRGGLPAGALLYRKPIPWDRLIGFLEAHSQRRLLTSRQARESGRVALRTKGQAA